MGASAEVLASAPNLDPEGLAAAVLPADEERPAAALGCLLLCADAGEGLGDTSAKALALIPVLIAGILSALIAERLSAVFSPADGGCAAAVVGCLLVCANTDGGAAEAVADTLATAGTLDPGLAEDLAAASHAADAACAVAGLGSLLVPADGDEGLAEPSANALEPASREEAIMRSSTTSALGLEGVRPADPPGLPR